MTTNEIRLRGKIRLLLCVFIIGLVLSGLTAFPLEWELTLLKQYSSNLLNLENPLNIWIQKVYIGLNETNKAYPFLAYGTDWLAFAHIVIAIAFIGPIIDPIKNIWVVHFGIIACFLVFPVAIIAGEIRAIPFYWRFIDCSFGAIGIIPLVLCNMYIKQLSQQSK